jgi:hypothetical protein
LRLTRSAVDRFGWEGAEQSPPVRDWSSNAIGPLEYAESLLRAAEYFLERAAQVADQPTLTRVLEAQAGDLIAFRETRVVETLHFLQEQNA